jgi:hypothetical protein
VQDRRITNLRFAAEDYIDIEFFGESDNNGCAAGQTAIQLNYFVNGQEKPVKTCLTFDATKVMRQLFASLAGLASDTADRPNRLTFLIRLRDRILR